MAAARQHPRLHRMALTALPAEALERLARLECDGHPVLSVYFDLDPSRFPTPVERDTELSALLSRAGAHDADAKRARQAVQEHPELVHGASGIAVFSCAATGALEILPLPGPVEPLAIVDAVPWLEPLAAMVATGDWGVVVISRRAARLFRGGPDGLVQFAAVEDELHPRHSQGGMSQARFQRGIEQQVAEHARHTAELLLRAHRRRSFDHLAIVAADELWPVVEASLPRDLQDRVAGVIRSDLERAPAEEIVRAVSPVLEAAEHERERALVSRLEDALGTGGPAVVGLDEVLASLREQRVETLLLADQGSLTAGLCTRCGRLHASSEGRCGDDGEPLSPVDAVEHLIALAAQQSSVEVAVLAHESDALLAHGQIAALLRW
jgi:peptide chain release factor subunit 1